MKLKKKEKLYIKNTNEQQSLFGKVIEAFEKEDWKEASRLVIELEEKNGRIKKFILYI